MHYLVSATLAACIFTDPDTSEVDQVQGVTGISVLPLAPLLDTLIVSVPRSLPMVRITSTPLCTLPCYIYSYASWFLHPQVSP